MENIFEQIEKENEQQYSQLIELWVPYMREIYSDDETANESDSELAQYAKQRVNIQGQRKDMFFELVKSKEETAGFAFYAVDLGGIKDLIKPGYGYIMELYIKPSYRRKGIATNLYNHIKENFVKLGVSQMYLTPDSASGIPFWTSIGFKNCGKIDPDNKMPIYTLDL